MLTRLIKILLAASSLAYTVYLFSIAQTGAADRNDFCYGHTGYDDFKKHEACACLCPNQAAKDARGKKMVR